MIEEKSVLMRELSLIFVLLSFIFFGFGDVFFSLIPGVAIIVLCGFIWSIMRKEATPRTDLILVNLGAVCIFAWIINALMHSYFGYKEVILILLQAAGFLVVIFCFCLSTPYYRTYIIFMSVPLVLGAMLYTQRPVLSGVFLLGIFFCWFVLLKTRFAQLFDFVESFRHQKLGFLVVPGISFAVVILCASFVFFTLHVPYLRVGGFFDTNDLPGMDELKNLEKSYYEKQSIFQEQASKFALNSGVSDDRHAIMKKVSVMLGDPAEIMEVERAHQGLKSLFNTPGPGNQRREGQEVTHSLGEYGEIKAKISVIKGSDRMMRKAREKEARGFGVVSMLLSLGSLRVASTESAITAASKRLDQNINALGATGMRENDFVKRAKELKQWQVYGAYLKQLRGLKTQLESAPLSMRGDFLNAVSRIEDIQTGEDVRQSLQEVARIRQRYPEGKNYSRKLDEILALRVDMYLGQKEDELIKRFSTAGASEETMKQVEKSLNELMSAPVLNPQARMNENVIKWESDKLLSQLQKVAVETEMPKSEERNLVNETSALKKVLMSKAKKEQAQMERFLKEEQEKKLQAAKAPKKFLMFLRAFVIILLLLICCFCGFLAYQFFILFRERRQIAAEFNNPRSFIIKLYANMQRILAVFGMRQKEQFPPLLRAQSLGRIYGISVGEFLSFSEKFEEAWYSRHTLSPEDALSALKSYNLFLDVLLNYNKTMTRLQKVFLSMLEAVPLKIMSR